MVEFSDSYDRVIRKIFATIAGAEKPQKHFMHARNTLQWVERLDPDKGTNEVLRIAALGSDLQVVTPGQVKPSNYSDYLSYCNTANYRSAEITANIMKECGSPQDLIDSVFDVIRTHEKGGGNPLSIILRDANALSYFDVVVVFDYDEMEESKILKRMQWEFNKLPSKPCQYLYNFTYPNQSLNRLLNSILERNKEMSC